MGSDSVRDVSISWQEVGNGIFDPTAYETNPPVPTPNGNPDYLAEVQNFAAIPNLVVGDNGEEHPGIRLFWDAIDDITVEGVDIQYWPDNDPSQVFSSFVTKDVTVFQIVNGLTSLSDWWVRTRLRVASGTRPVAWSASVKVHTLKAQGDQNPIDYEGLDDDLKGYLGWIGPQMREIIRQAEELATTTSDNHNANYADIQRLSRQLTSTFSNAQASWQEDILVATGPNSAIGQQLIRINAQLWDNTGASILQLFQARVDGVEDEVESQATAITSLTTVVNNVSANATFRMASSVAPSGWNSRIGMQVEGGTVGDWKSAGLFLDVNSTQARIALMAAQIVFTNGTEFFHPFVIQNNVMYGEGFVMDWAKIVNVSIEWAQIQSAVINNLIVGTSNLDFNAVTATTDTSYNVNTSANDVTLSSFVINSPQGNTILLDWFINASLSIIGGSTQSTTTIWLINITTGAVIRQFSYGLTTGQSTAVSINTAAIDSSAVPGNNTYQVRKTNNQSGTTLSGSGYLKSLVWKR
jgi:hypothetical protein